MGLLSIIKKIKQKEREIRLLLVGLDNAGKTTIVKRIEGEDITTVSPTLGFSIKTLQYKRHWLNIWDVGGQRSLRSYWRNYYERTDALIWVVDSADTGRMLDCRAELQTLLKEEKLAGAALLIFANKQDLPSALSPEEITKVLELELLVGRHWRVLACSAVASTGLLEGFDWVVSDVHERLYMLA